ncbi:hypothetical protein NUSPORA_01442 [Nucleospora cyclopteri]
MMIFLFIFFKNVFVAEGNNFMNELKESNSIETSLILCPNRLKLKLLKELDKMFNQMTNRYDNKLKIENTKNRNLISNIEKSTNLEKEIVMKEIYGYNLKFNTNYIKIQEEIFKKKNIIKEIFMDICNELNTIMTFTELALFDLLNKYNEQNQKIENENKKKEGKLEEDTTVLFEQLSINIENENKTKEGKLEEDTTVLVEQNQKIENENKTKEGKLEEDTTVLFEKLSLNIDKFIKYLIELAEKLNDTQLRNSILNNIIKEKKLSKSQLEFLLEKSQHISDQQTNNNPFFLTQIMFKSNINRCETGITLKLDQWNKIEKQISGNLSDKIFSMDFMKNGELIKKSYIHIISDSLEIDHTKNNIQLDEFKIERCDFDKNVPNKSFNPLDKETFIYSSSEDIKDLNDKEIVRAEFTDFEILKLLYGFSNNSNDVKFVQVPSIYNKSSILGCWIKESKPLIVLFPMNQILLIDHKMFQLFLFNVYKK